MNTKKLIGTILGVIAFAILIAGATYAWLVINASVTTGTYTTGSKNFVITYNGGTEVGKVLMLSSGNATKANITSAGTAEASTQDGWLAVTASKSSTSTKASHFKINLVITNNGIVSDSLIYAICKGACTTTGALATIANNGTVTCGTNVTTCGSIAGESTDPVVLFDDTSTFNVDGTVSDTTYNVYFWLNSNSITADDVGKSFEGYIQATAVQGE